MNAVLTLQQRGQMSAGQLADVLQRPIELVYVELVRAESQGLVRVNATDDKRRTWEAM